MAQLKLLPEGQGEKPVGFIGDAKTFAGIWKAFRPTEADLVLFARNTQFYNRIVIGKVTLTNGLAEGIARESMSAMPIGDKVSMVQAVVDRQGILGIQAGEHVLPVKSNQ